MLRPFIAFVALGGMALAGASSAACGRIGYDPLSLQATDAGLDDAGPMVDAFAGIAQPRVAIGEFHSCTLTSEGSLFCWGGNYGGELGQGDFDSRLSATQVGAAGQWRQLTSGAYHLCAADDAGAAYCWGANGNGDLGVGDYTERTTPALLVGPTDVVGMSSGASDNVAITGNGERWGWGDNRNTGALGVGDDFGPVIDPVMALGSGWTSITTGYDSHGCGIQSGGVLSCWGDNDDGELGVNDTVEHWDPTPVSGGGSWLEVSAGLGHTCAIRDDETLHCWGSNARGEFGEAGGDTSVPRAVLTDQRWASIEASLFGSCGIDTSQRLWCWGLNDEGQLGIGTTSSGESATEVAPGTRWHSVDMDWHHTCGIQTDASIWCWGNGADGQLGQGDTEGSLVPVQVVLP